jgi:molybdopterin/thiamine biosynthesis adenylyltransferase
MEQAVGRDNANLPPLTDDDREAYEWQLPVAGFGELGQQRLKGASVLISRCGGVGGAAAYYLAAAGVGRLILAHGGHLKAGDLNRQILMTHAGLGEPRVHLAARRLRDLNPRMQIETVAENVSESNAAQLVGQADLVMDCAPLFVERMAMNRHAVLQNKPLVHCAMYELQAQITCVLPGRSACLACLCPQEPAAWKRKFPVFGAVAGMIGAMGAMQAILLIGGFGRPLRDQMLTIDLRDGTCLRLATQRNPACPVCRPTAGE